MISYTIFVIDDEESIRNGISMALGQDYKVESFPTAKTALRTFEKNRPDLVLLDVGLPDMNGIALLKRLKELQSDLLVIMITAYEDVSTVITAMKLGVYDYIIKPLHIEGLEVTIRNALESLKLRKEVQTLQEKYLRENVPFFIGESNAIQNVMEFVGLVAKSPDTPILIEGETGTGKELIASAIHYRSPNYKGALVPVNCASIPKDLVETELFGYEKGAFSGAHECGKKGLIEEAADGTLFLDEVGDLTLETQAKLLRFLEEGEFYRVGGTKRIQIHARVVSATNKDLEKMIQEEWFRKDLYFRLGVIKVQIPSLNERKDDIIPLAKHFMFEFSRKFDKMFSSISPETEEILLAHHWTGNVRELKNIIEHAVLIGKGPILQVADLGLDTKRMSDIKPENILANFPPLTPAGIDFSVVLQAIERHYFEQAIKMAGGNESNAAKLLNMNHHTFRYRRKKL